MKKTKGQKTQKAKIALKDLKARKEIKGAGKQTNTQDY